MRVLRIPETVEPDEWGEGYLQRIDVDQSHYISRQAFQILMRDPFTADDFEEFIEERELTFLSSIKQLADRGETDQPGTGRAGDGV